METTTPPPLTRPPAPRVAGWRRRTAVSLAAGLALGAIAVPVTLRLDRSPASSAVAAESPTAPRETQELLPATPGGAYGGYAWPGVQPTRVQSDATDAQSQGLVLIDTVLSDGEAAGTGMVLDPDGLVLTNYHVVEGSTSIEVTVADTGETYAAEVVGRDAAADVALLQLDDAEDLTPVTLDDDGDPSVSDPVTAVGNAEGQGYLSAATGTVQALAQSITTSDTGVAPGESLADLIQTDAAVVGGYSGGALLDAEGEVVGITTAASSGGQVVSYAVPIQDALAVVTTIEAGADTVAVAVGPAAYLGVAVDDSLAVAAVEDGTPAADAGIGAGDVLSAVDGTPLRSFAELDTALSAHEPGERVSVSWTTTQGATRVATLTLAESPVN